MAEAKTTAIESSSNVGARMTYEDMREWMVEAEKLGELRVVKGASWEKDIGLAAEVVLHDEGAPCIVFDDVPGCPPGFRMLINFFAGKRKCMTMGFPTEWNKLELTDGLHAHMKTVDPIPHKIVDSGPVYENIMEGDDIDVEKFPAPMWHDKDGGRYIGTGSYNITRDPDDGWINCGTYRVMVHDAKRVGLYISPGKHGRIHRDKYFERGEECKFVILVGEDPLLYMLSASPLPEGVCELDFAGGLRGEAIECIKGPYTGFPIPADAEIAIEGVARPGKVREEGPFGEWTGYYGSKMRAEPVMDIKAIYHRNDPIILGCPPQRPPDEMCRYRAITRSAMLRRDIHKAGVPDVAAVWAHEVGNGRLLLAVSIKQRYPGHSRQAGQIASQCRAAAYASKYVIVVDDDVDVTKLDQLIWAMMVRTDPKLSIDFITGAWDSPADPILTPQQRAVGDMTHSVAIIDACRPFHWKDEFPMSNAPSPEVLKKAEEKFGYLMQGR